MKKRKRVVEEFTRSEGATKDLRDFEEELQVDQDDIDDAVIRQPELFWHVSEQLVYAIDLRDTIKKELDEAEADEDNKIRALAEANEEKITEPFVKKQIAAQPKIQRLNRELLDAKKQAALWEAMKESFSQRSYAVNKLADLHISRSIGAGGSVNLKDAAVEGIQRRRDAEYDKRRARR